MAKRGRPRRVQPVRNSPIHDSGVGKAEDVLQSKLVPSGELLGDPALEDPAAVLIEIPVVAQSGSGDSGKKIPPQSAIMEVGWGVEQDKQQRPPGQVFTWKKKSVPRRDQLPSEGVGQQVASSGKDELVSAAGKGASQKDELDWQEVRKGGKTVVGSRLPDQRTEVAGKGVFDPLLAIGSSELSEVQFGDFFGMDMQECRCCGPAPFFFCLLIDLLICCGLGRDSTCRFLLFTPQSVSAGLRILWLMAYAFFRNYVVQFVFSLQIARATRGIIYQLKNHYCDLSLQKHSSHVVEKCLKYAGEEDQSRIIQELIGSCCQLERILHDPYGNYVIQAALNNSRGAVHAELMNAIEPHVPMLRMSPFGKNILPLKEIFSWYFLVSPLSETAFSSSSPHLHRFVYVHLDVDRCPLSVVRCLLSFVNSRGAIHD
ncbi:hypothetical protein Dimus_021355 [Dionaea muscipula]